MLLLVSLFFVVIGVAIFIGCDKCDDDWEEYP